MNLNTHLNRALKFILACTTTITIQQSTAQTGNPDKVHIGFIYPISTHGTHAALDTNTFSFHVLSGVSAEERGLAFSGLTNVVRNNVHGLAFAGFSNHVGKHVEGLLFAGFANTYRSNRGMAFAGFTNVAADSITGSQFAGFLNTAGKLKGLQAAGFANIAKTVSGSQFAGFANTASQIEGSQFAGFANITARKVKGSQLSGFVNVAQDVSGSQLSGFINVAGKVRGAQIAGFINVADSSDCPIGIINIIKNGEKSIGLNVDEIQTTLLSFRSGGKILYGIIGAGYNFKNEDEVYAFEIGLGAHLLRTRTLRLNTELGTQYLESFHRGEYFKSSLRVMPSLKLGKTLELYGGPTLSMVNTNTSEGETLIRNYIWEHHNRWGYGFTGIYIGYSAGLNIHF